MQFLMGETGGNSPAEMEGEVWLRWLAGHLRERGWLVLAVALVSTVAGVAVTSQRPRIYEATSTIQYDPNPTRPLGNEVQDVADPVSHYWATHEFFQTENRVIGSVEMARRVTKTLKLHEDPSFTKDPGEGEERTIEATAKELQMRIEVEPVEDTRLVLVHVRDTQPERARQIADTVVDLYVEKTVEDRLASSLEANQWLGSQLESLRKQLEAAEHALHAFKKEHHVLSVSMEDRQNLVASNIQAINGRLTDAQNRKIELRARVTRLKKAIDREPGEIDPLLTREHPILIDLLAGLRHKQSERKNLSVKYGANHPSIVTLDGEIRLLEERLHKEKQGLLASAQADLDQVRRIEEGLKSAAKGAHASGLELNLREIEYRRLNRERDNKAQLYELLLQRRAETNLTHMLKTTHARVLDHATLPEKPVAPHLLRQVGISFGAGLLLGLLLVFGLALFDRRVRSIERLETFGAMVLGVVPPFVRDTKTIRLRPSMHEGDRVDEHGLVVHEQPTSASAEAFRMIRTNLASMAPADRPRTLLVASADTKEGKTAIATNLAVTFAKFGDSVLLVDTDLRRPRIHRLFGLKREVGVSSLVIDGVDPAQAVRKTNIDGLHVLPAGSHEENTSELLHSSPFERLLERAREKYDWVVFDSPPLSAVADAAIIAPQVDGVMLVVRAGDTTSDSVSASLRQLRDVSSNILGFVLNDVDTRLRSYAGAYKYRYGLYRGAEDRDVNAA